MHTRTAAHEPIPPAASCSEPSFIGARDTRPFVYQLSAASFALRPQSSWDRDRTAHKENKLLLPGPLQKKFAIPDLNNKYYTELNEKALHGQDKL